MSESGLIEHGPRARRQRVSYKPSRRSGDYAFRDAVRHSTRVRWLKILLPALAIAGAGLFWGTLRLIPDGFAELVSFGGIDIESNSVIMESPHISGFEGTRRAYEVKAVRAVQSLTDPKVITFSQISASIGLDEAGTALITATLGTYDGNRNTLSLRDGITLETTDGYAARFAVADIDLGAGELVSDQPLEIRSADGLLRANRVRAEEGGKRILFDNGVSLSFLPPGDLMASGGKDGNP
ncbi:MAG: hypothetical protein ACTSU0_12900 [Alphaproteobacteria bacterium]